MTLFLFAFFKSFFTRRLSTYINKWFDQSYIRNIPDLAKSVGSGVIKRILPSGRVDGEEVGTVVIHR